MNYFSEIFGLITKADPTTENGGLFLAHYLVLKLMLGMHPSQADLDLYTAKMENAYVQYGLYLRSKEHKTRTVSQDEISGFMVASHILNTHHAKEIWWFLLEHNGDYPATGETKVYNPGAYYPWAVLGGNFFSFLMAPWYTINLLISTNKPANNTSSKLIYLDELYCMKNMGIYNRLLWEYYSWRMKLMYGPKWVAGLYDIYFGGEDIDHPLRQLSRKI